MINFSSSYLAKMGLRIENFHAPTSPFFDQVKQQDLAKAIRCLSGGFKIFDEAGYHNLAPKINDFESRLDTYDSGKCAYSILQ